MMCIKASPYLDRFFDLLPEYQPDGRKSVDVIFNGVAEAFKNGSCSYEVRERLLDCMMPGINGFEAISRLKASPSHADIPVIFLTGLNDNSSEARGIGDAFVEYGIVHVIGAAARFRQNIGA